MDNGVFGLYLLSFFKIDLHVRRYGLLGENGSGKVLFVVVLL